MRCGGEGVAVWLEPGIREENATCRLGQEIPGNWKSGQEWEWGQGRGEVRCESPEVAGMTLLHELENRGEKWGWGAALSGEQMPAQPSSSTC